MTDLSSNYPDIKAAAQRMRERAQDESDPWRGMWGPLSSWLQVCNQLLARGDWPEAPSLPIGVAGAFVRADKIERGIHFMQDWQAGLLPSPWKLVKCWCGWEYLGEAAKDADMKDVHNDCVVAFSEHERQEANAWQ